MRKEKQLLLNEIKQKVDDSAAMIVINYKSLPPNTSWKLRDLLGKQGSQEINATWLAAKAGTIAWHLFTGITERVRRCYSH